MSTDELKDVCGGYATKDEIPDVSGLKCNNLFAIPVQVTTSLNNNNTHLEGKKKGNLDSFSWEAASD